MKIEKNPFSLYDFLGYFIPGAIFLYGIMFALKYDPIANTSFPFLQMNIDQYLIVILVCYIIGHLISYLSSVSVEVFSIWSLGYPSKYLLGCEFRGFWHNLFKEKHIVKNILKITMCIYIFPVVIVDIFARKIFKLKQLLGKPMDEITADMVSEKIEKFVLEKYEVIENHLPIDEGDKDFFRFIYHYSMEKCPAHCVKLDNYVALYGFTRTLCFASLSIAWAYIAKIIVNGINMPDIVFGLSCCFISSLLYLDFNKFYRKFSLEAFMAFASID